MTLSRSWLLLALPSLLLGCDRNVLNYEYHEHAASAPVPSPGAPDGGGPPAPLAEGVPALDTSAEALSWDVFGSAGAHYWFIVSQAELERMNALHGIGDFTLILDVYSPTGGSGLEATFADHLVVTTPGSDPHSADFGKIQVRLVGQSTSNPWTPRSLPNLRLDADEFVRGKRIGGVEHLRLNNSVNGGIFREKLTLDLYGKLGYPAPRATYAWVSSTVWGPDTAVPYVLVQPYKRQLCEEQAASLGGGCANMWELVGDLGSGGLELPENCQLSSCDNSRARLLEQRVQQTPLGAGYEAALADWIDWDAFRKFQCLSWILETGDDAVHAANNVVLAEGADGKFRYLPYSVDISLGRTPYDDTTLPGYSVLATGCQSDPECWASTITACEGLVADFVAADPVGLLNALHAELEALGMLRDGDDSRYRTLVTYLEVRLTELPVELELNRAAPYFPCEPGLVRCDGGCLPAELCSGL